MKSIRIAQSDGLDWKKGLRKYVTVYRSIIHPTTGKSPAELLFNQKRGKLPELIEVHTDQEVCDHDTEQKAKSKLYADTCRGAQLSEVSVGDTVLLRQDKTDKFSTTFNATNEVNNQKMTLTHR